MNTLSIQKHGHGSPLVMLHGWGFSSEIWAPVLPALAKKYQVITIDLPGHGKSPFLPQFHDFHEVVKSLIHHTPSQAIWLGWSLGGLLALGVAQHAPDHVKQLLQVASTPKFMTDEEWDFGVKPTIMKQFEQQLLANTQATLQRFVMLQTLGLSNARQESRELSAYIQESLPSHKGLSWGLEILRKTDMRPALSTLQCPIHYLLGAKDSLVPVAIQAYFMQNYPQVGVEVLPTAAHMPFFSHPDLFLQWFTHATSSSSI